MTADAASPGFTSIPTFSMAAWRAPAADRDHAAQALVQACHEVGFFMLTDHGIGEEFTDRVLEVMRGFFELPIEDKELIDKRRSRHFRGWERVGAELTANRVDYREQVDMSTENPPYPPDALPAYLRLDGPNQWLPEDLLPDFHAVVDEFMTRLGILADELMGILAVGLGLPQDAFVTVFGERPLSFAKFINYPRTPPGEAGVNGHHDAGFLTILIQHGVGGLQVLNPDGAWIDVPPTPGSFVVNLGEMLQSMTGNYLVATTHRVITGSQRYSSAYFHGPDLRASLAPLDLDRRFADAVARSPRHRDAGFMAKRDELLAGGDEIGSSPVPVFGEQMWNYYVRSYPALVKAHYPDLV